MAEPTDEEKAAAAQRKEIAEAFADGLEIFHNREAERAAKAGTGEGGTGDNNDGGTPKRRSLGEILMGKPAGQ